MAADLLKPADNGGFGQGLLILKRATTIDDEKSPWDKNAVEYKQETLDGAVRGVEKELVGKELGGTIILASDQEAITTPPVMGCLPGDIFSVDGVEKYVISYTPLPAAGITVAARFILR